MIITPRESITFAGPHNKNGNVFYTFPFLLYEKLINGCFPSLAGTAVQTGASCQPLIYPYAKNKEFYIFCAALCFLVYISHFAKP